ncbi:hypothetical protein EK21DRAFT_111915 [Setomelanomma holmii]|uniref:Uncharacterized protein n=1 Tax=Setomelanomma holmii TaxID=210430 RepID=A0A9P4LN67_9PLEO|nr:hypothetical protein EK21DRAFT_111915 [Setomelanomma holmii]
MEITWETMNQSPFEAFWSNRGKVEELAETRHLSKLIPTYLCTAKLLHLAGRQGILAAKQSMWKLPVFWRKTRTNESSQKLGDIEVLILRGAQTGVHRPRLDTTPGTHQRTQDKINDDGSVRAMSLCKGWEAIGHADSSVAAVGTKRSRKVYKYP